ncbi:hypothetical protein BRC2024_PQPTKSFJ_CDS_0029 [Tegunavirus sp. BRC001]
MSKIVLSMIERINLKRTYGSFNFCILFSWTVYFSSICWYNNHIKSNIMMRKLK